MLLPNRHGSAESYRYGFGGQEKDDEIKGEGNSYNYGARFHDPRIGRWLAVDPLMNKYPNVSPYNHAVNNPLVFIDTDGKDWIIFFEKTTTTDVAVQYMGKTGISKQVNKHMSYVVIPAPGPDRIFYSRTAEELSKATLDWTESEGHVFRPTKDVRKVSETAQFYELQPFRPLGINDRYCSSCKNGDEPITETMGMNDADFITMSKLIPDELKEKMARKDARYNMLSAYQTEFKVTTIGLAVFDIAMFLDGVSPSTLKALKSINSVNLTLKMKEGWTATQRAAAIEKVKALSNANTFVVKNPVRAPNTRGRFTAAGNTVESAEDVDHIIDLQLGGADEVWNMAPLDYSVNRSVGSQINHLIKDLPEGTLINKIEIIDP